MTHSSHKFKIKIKIKTEDKKMKIGKESIKGKEIDIYINNKNKLNIWKLKIKNNNKLNKHIHLSKA